MGEPEPPAGGFAESDFLSALRGWAASERVAGAAAARSRQRALSESSAGSATFIGVLVDLAERRTQVSLVLDPATRLTGRLVGVGRDFCVLEQPGGQPLVVALAPVSTVTPAAADGGPVWAGGDRPAPLALSLVGLLADLSGEGAAVSIMTPGGPVRGSLVSVGEDVVTLRAAGSAPRIVHLPVSAVRWFEFR